MTYDIYDNLLKLQKNIERDHDEVTYDGQLFFRPDIAEAFSYHKLTDDQVKRRTKIMEAGRYFAQLIVECTLTYPDQAAAIRKVREAVMTANAAISIEV